MASLISHPSPQILILVMKNLSLMLMNTWTEYLKEERTLGDFQVPRLWANKKYHEHCTLPPDMAALLKKSYGKHMAKLGGMIIIFCKANTMFLSPFLCQIF